jgi:cyanophycinase-like exopeptidase
MSFPRTTGPGSVYLVASPQGDTFKRVVDRALAPVRLTGRKPRVALSYAAVADSFAGRTFMKGFAAKTFFGAHTDTFRVKGERDPMDPSEARAIVAEADLVFLSGGDTVLGARILTSSGADAWIREARERGAACVGISAGAILLGAWWASWPEDHALGAKFDGGSLVRCAGIVPDVVVDCHAEGDHWAELKMVSAMLEERGGPLPRRFGIPTGAALAVHHDGGLEPIGGPLFEL